MLKIPLAELVDLGGRGEVSERVERGAEAEEEVGMIWARGCSRAEGEGSAVSLKNTR